MLAQVLWNSPRSLPLAVAVAIVAVAAVVWLYPPQVKGLGWAWRWGLPGLRAAGMLALAAALLRPAVMRPKTGQERGVILVLVDRSRSMAVVDNARSPAELVALADGLGMLPAGARSGAAAGVAALAADARPRLAAVERAWGDLDYARVAGRGVEAARARVEAATAELRRAAGDVQRAGAALGDGAVTERLSAIGVIPNPDAAEPGPRLAALRAALDAVGAAATQVQGVADAELHRTSPAVKAVCDELSRKSRYELVEEALLRPGTGLLARLPGEAVVRFGIAEDLSPLPLQVPASDAPGGAPASLPSTAPATVPSREPAFGAPPDGRRSDIVGCLRKALEGFEGREVAAVVLLSDGRPAGAASAVTAGLGASGAPVYAVAAAPGGGALRDVSVGRLVAPASGFVGEVATVRVEVRQQGVQEGQVRVKLTTDAGRGAEQQVETVRLVEGRAAPAEFQVKLARPGAQRVSVSLDGVGGEATAENNGAERWVKVLSQKVKVAAFAMLPGWDFQYLRNALARTPWAELRAAVLNPSSPRVPLTPEQILAQDVLVLYDVPVAALDDARWTAVYRLVSERGGSVLLLAGPGHLPAEYGAHFVASSLLPYPPDLAPTWRVWPGEEPMFRLVPDLEASNEPVLRVGGEGGAAAVQRWQMLPGFYHVLPVGRLKPGAQALLVEASSGEPVLTQMRVGAGRTFLFGATETWRWRSGPAAEDLQDRFWLQLIRHAAGDPYGARSDRLALDVDRVSFEVGQTAQAKVRALSAVSADALRLEVVQGAGVARTLSPSPAGGAESGRFTARVGPLPAGDYELRLSEAGTAGAAGAVSLPLHVTAGYETELADVSGDRSLLSRLAESTGGELVPLEQVGRLAGRLHDRAAHRSSYVEERLWDSPYLFVLVVACFAAEWAARKRLGLA
jgi:hypothetical protein